MIEVYTEKELAVVEDHIEKYFGKCDSVFHEVVSPDIHVDVNVIGPTKQRNHYTLITMGMGAHQMNIPAELKAEKIDRAELLITLPPDWKLNDRDEKYYWPIRWLKILARFPIENNTWLGWGHSLSCGGAFAENTNLSEMLLTMPYYFGEKSASCQLPNKDIVRFFQLIPLYSNEMEYKTEHGAEALERLFPSGFDMILDLDRKNLFEK